VLFAAPEGGLLNLDNFRRREWAARIYDLRSTFASNALAAGVTVFEPAKIMGSLVRMIDPRRRPTRRSRRWDHRAPRRARSASGRQHRYEGGSAMSDDAVERQSDAELRQELQRQLGRLARLMDDGTIDDPAVAPLVKSLEERIDALEAQLEKADEAEGGQR
jgi:hypothetical protein